MVRIIKRAYNHYGMWFHTYLNADKLEHFSNKNEVLFKFTNFMLRNVVRNRVPDQYFTEEADRCYNFGEVDCTVFERPSRYKDIIEKALANKGDRQQHYVVLKALVESPKTNFVICELPIWLTGGKRVGHIDAIELSEEKPSIFNWDFKPHNATDIDASGQVSVNALILATMLKIPLTEIKSGWFDETAEVLLID